jgi:hypothetical protein
MQMDNKPRADRDTEKKAYFIKSHAILDKESYPLIEVAYIALQDEVLLGLR